MPAGKTRGVWEAWTVLCALAAATSRIELGPFAATTVALSPDGGAAGYARFERWMAWSGRPTRETSKS